MQTSITPFNAASLNEPEGQMRPWPALAGRAFCLSSFPGETIFFFDSAPADKTHSLDSPPVFVLIHGLGDEADSFRHIIPLLNATGFRVLVPDLPGFGRSVAKGRINLKNHAAAVLRLIEAVIPPNSQSPVFLAGNSLGALVAEAAAFRKPNLIRGLVLIDGSIPGGPSNPGLIALAKLLFSRKWYRSYRGAPKDAWASLYPYYADLESMPPEDKEFLQERVMARVESPTQERAFFATQRSLIKAFILSSAWFARKIRSYNGKILLIWGEKDRIIPLSSTEKIRKLRPDIRLEVIPGAGHLPHQEKPAETARLMADFALAQ